MLFVTCEKRTIYDGLEDYGQVSCTPAELSSLHITSVLKNYRASNFVVVGHRRNIFKDKNFPIYGIIEVPSVKGLSLGSNTIQLNMKVLKMRIWNFLRPLLT